MAAHTCAICDSSDSKFCSLCHSILYCSRECQKTDWPLHKKVCKKFTTLPPRPSLLHRLAIHFPADLKEPQLIWINCPQQIDDDDGSVSESPDVDGILSKYDLPKHLDLFEYLPITRNALRGFDLSHKVEVICRDSFLSDGSTPNICVEQTTGGKKIYDWRGPIAVMRLRWDGSDSKIYEDITATDFRVAVDYFLSY